MLSNCRDFHVHMCCCCLGHYVDSLPANNQSLLMSGQYCLDCKQGEFQSQKSCLQILYSIYIWRYLFIAIIYHISCLLMSTYLLLLQYETCFMLTQWFPGQNWVCVCVCLCVLVHVHVCVCARNIWKMTREQIGSQDMVICLGFGIICWRGCECWWRRWAGMCQSCVWQGLV